jgi:branched-chain amino acid transport system ATP-binding protein
MAVLRAEGLGKRFGGLAAVTDLNLESAPGSILGLIGPNGAGKTTIFNLLSGFIPQDTGTVTLDGKSLDGLSPERRCRRGLVRTFQIVQPFRGISVRDNVVMGTLHHNSSLKAGASSGRRDT